MKNKTVYYAKQLHEAMAGIGTKEDDLTRLLVTRLEVKSIKIICIKSFQRIY